MPKKIAIDTNFLINYSDKTKDFHKITHCFADEIERLECEIYIPNIVLSEFYAHKKYTERRDMLDALRHIILNFNIDDAMLVSEIMRSMWENLKLHSSDRNCIKDDVKIVASCVNKKIDFILTHDTKGFKNILNNIPDAMIEVVDYASDGINILSGSPQRQLDLEHGTLLAANAAS